MKLTAREFNDKPAEAFRMAEKGEPVIIYHGRYPHVVFELRARDRGEAMRQDYEEILATDGQNE